MLFADIFADSLPATVFLCGSIAAFAVCAAAASALLRRALPPGATRRGDYWLRYRPANAKRRAAFAFLARAFAPRP